MVPSVGQIGEVGEMDVGRIWSNAKHSGFAWGVDGVDVDLNPIISTLCIRSCSVSVKLFRALDSCVVSPHGCFYGFFASHLII